MSTREDRYYRKFSHCLDFKGRVDMLVNNIQFALEANEITIARVHVDRIQSLSAELTKKIEEESK